MKNSTSQIDLDHSPDQYKERITVKIRENGSRRVTVNFSEPQLTDQSMAKASDINNILKQYSSQGAFPQQITDPSYFRDNTDIPSIEEAFNITNKAIEAFEQLHPSLRKLMDNDPSNLESFISNPENSKILEQYGVIIPKTVAADPIKEVKPAPQDPKTPKE